MKRNIFLTCLFLLGVFYLSTLGWWGYKKWKPRRSTFGNKIESIDRHVFVKDLHFETNLKVNRLNFFIEKGFKYGYFGDFQTRLLNQDKYPYQISYVIDIDTIHNFSYEDLNYKYFPEDTISNVYLLKTKDLEKMMMIKVSVLNNQKWDSIGYIKIWDKQKN